MATGTLSPAHILQFFDTNGNPLSAGKLYTYVAGTSTPVATYTDVSLSVPHANPIILDSAGRPANSGAAVGIYLSAGSSYKFVLKTSADATVWTLDNILAVPGTSNPTTDLSTVNLRLTLTSGTPVTTANITGATSVFIEPFRGNRIALYDGATWNLRTVTATSFAVPATTSTLYDVFVYDNASTPTYETVAWTNDTTRATALTTQDGVLVKSGAVTRLYLGSFRTTTVNGQTEDSSSKRYLWNYYNRIRRNLFVSANTTWNYTTATIRQANATATNQADIVVGWAEVPIDLSLAMYVSNSAGGVGTEIGIGEDSTSTFSSAQVGAGYTNTTAAGVIYSCGPVRLLVYPSVGRHFFSQNEYSAAGGTTTWYANDPIGVGSQRGGLNGFFEG